MAIPVRLEPQTVAAAMEMMTSAVRDSEFLRKLDRESLFAWIRLNLADVGLYSTTVGASFIFFITHQAYIEQGCRAIDEAIVAEARKQLSKET